jgi:glycosyltransferase involved in cell wall biosynthesis
MAPADPRSGGARAVLAGRRIVVLVHSLQMGGGERQALMLVRQLHADYSRSVELWSLTRGSGTWAGEEAERIGVPHRVLGFGTPSTAFGVLHMAAGLSRRLRSWKTDFIIPFLDLPNLLANLAWRTTGALGCIWNQRNAEPALYHRTLQRLAYRMSGSIVGNSKDIIASLERSLGHSRKPTFVIYNGVQLPKPKAPRSAWRERLNIDHSTFVGCMVANLSRYKDHTTLVKAWKIVVDDMASRGHPQPPVLVLAGRHDDAAPAVCRLADQVGMAEHIRFPGLVNDISGLLAASDCGLLSSLSEGCPNAVLEYMAAGLPVVSADLPCVREIVPESNWEYFATPASPESFAAAVVSLVEHRSVLPLLAEQNRRIVESRFSPEQMAKTTVEAIASSVPSRRFGIQKAFGYRG